MQKKAKEPEINYAFYSTDPETEIRDAFVRSLMSKPYIPNAPQLFCDSRAAYMFFRDGWQMRKEVPTVRIQNKH